MANEDRWLYTPRGCAVLYVPVRNQHLIRTTLPTSWGFIPSSKSPSTGPSTMQSGGEKSAFEALFEFVATSDDTPYFCIPAAIRFRNEICGGDDRIYAYLYQLANEAAEIVAAALGTEVMQEPGLTDWKQSLLRKCGMTTVRLPIPVKDGWEDDPVTAVGKKRVCPPLEVDDAQSVCRWLQNTMMDWYETFLPVFSHGGWLWTRLSAQVYLQKSDFEWAAGILKQLCEQVGRKEMVAAKL